jgi:Ca2+/H+ antiporter
MAERPGDHIQVDVGKLLDPKKYDFELKSPEKPEELQSRSKREEAEAEHRLRTQEAEDAHKRRIALMVHVFVMAIVAIAFLASVYIAAVKDPKTGLPDKAMGIITAIVAAGVGYMTGKGSK